MAMPRGPVHRARLVGRYAGAVAGVALAYLLWRALSAWIGSPLPPYLTFYPTVMALGLFAGFGPGLLATALSALSAAAQALPATGGLRAERPADLASLLVFVAVCLGLCAAAKVHRRDRQALQGFEAERARVGLAMIARSGRRLFTNEAFDEVFGRVGFVAPEDASREDSPMRRLREAVGRAFSGLTVEFEVRLPAQGGLAGPRHFAVSIDPPAPGSGGDAAIVVAVDVTARVEAQEALRRSELRYSAIYTTAMDAIVCVDPGQRVMLFNPAAEAMFGLRAEQILGEPMERLIPVRLRARHAQHVQSFTASGHTARRMQSLGRLVALRADGSEFPIEASIARLDVEGVRLMTVIVRDVSERVQVEERLRELAATLEQRVERRTRELSEASAAAQAANRAKSQFLANMSHEIRTPLNAILGLSGLVRGAIEAPEQVRRLQQIELAGQHLLALLSDVLDLSKIESGRLHLEEVDFHLEDVLQGVIAMVADAAHEKGLALALEARAMPGRLRGDPTRLRQALLNFAANAVKFTPAGAVTLKAFPLRESDGRLLARFEVRDTGIGLAAEHQARVFDAFVQADSTTTRLYGGTGLGLAITRHIARAMGGEVGVESAPGEGSVFWMTADLAIARAGGRGGRALGDAEVRESLRARHGRTRILLAEDNPINRLVVRETLGAVGLRVDEVEDGDEAVERVQRQAYDLVLMDMQMPRMGGLEAVRCIRALGLRMPVVALTANAFAEDRAACLHAGMAAFLAKPIAQQALYRTVLGVLEREATGDPSPIVRPA